MNSDPENRRIWTPKSRDSQFLAKNRSNIRAPESKLPLNVKIKQNNERFIPCSNQLGQ